MSQFDDELRSATSPLATERLPEGMAGETLRDSTNRYRRVGIVAGSAAAVALVAVVALGPGFPSLPFAAEGSSTGEPSPSSGAACHDLDPINAFSTEYRVYFPCANGSGLGSAPRVMGLAPPEDVLSSAIRDVLNGPVEQEFAAGMTSLAPAGSGDLLVTVDLQTDGLAVVAFDSRLRDLSLDPRFLGALEATGLQFEQVTALEFRLGSSCSEFFALFGAVCNHLAKPVEIAGDCPVVPPRFLPSGAGITTARPFPGKPQTVGWGAGEDTVIEEIGDRGGPPALEEGQDVMVRGFPGKARADYPEFAWVEDGCPYHVTLADVGDYVAIDYATVFGPVVAMSSPTPLPSAPSGMAIVEQDGIRLTLVLDRETTTFGQRVWAEVTVENIGSDVIHWGHSGSCAWPAGVQAWSAVEPPPMGRTDWPGDQGVLKNISVSSARSTVFGFTPAEFADISGNWGCTSDLVFDEIHPAGRIWNRFAWDTTGLSGMPPPLGHYTAESTFAYAGRGSLPPNADPFEHAVTVLVALEVQGPDTNYLAPGEAMDLLLADAALIRLLAANPRERWTGADFLWDQETWVLELRLQGPDQAVVATVNAITGAVSDVQLVARDPAS